MFPGELVEVAKTYGLPGVTVLMILLGWLIPRWTYKQVLAERDLWRLVAFRALGLSEKSMAGAEVATEVLRSLSDVANERAGETL